MATVRSEILKPDAIEAELRITMTIGEWRSLVEKLGQTNPEWELRHAFTALINKIHSAIGIERIE